MSVFGGCRRTAECAYPCVPTFGEEPKSRGFFHWSMDQWIGLRYTKPDSLAHRLVQFYISRNSVNQQIALFMDDLLYGRRKKISKHNPDPLFL